MMQHYLLHLFTVNKLDHDDEKGENQQFRKLKVVSEKLRGQKQKSGQWALKPTDAEKQKYIHL